MIKVYSFLQNEGQRKNESKNWIEEILILIDFFLSLVEFFSLHSLCANSLE